MVIIDLNLFARGKQDCLLLVDNFSIRFRKALAISSLANCTFHPIALQDTMRGEGAMTPKDYQLLPMDSFLTPWLFSLELPKGNTIHHNRGTLIVGDEGGMGKTFASALVAHRCLEEEPSGTIVVLCPPLLKGQWITEFKRLGHRAIDGTAGDLVSGNLPAGGVLVISKHSPRRQNFNDASKDNLSRKVILCILDEGHEGMIAAGNDPGAAMGHSIQEILFSSKRRLIATATPIRHDHRDLTALLKASIKDEYDCTLLDGLDINTQWLSQLRSEWLPNLEKLNQGEIDEAGRDCIVELLPEMCPFLTGHNLETVQTALRDQLMTINENSVQRFRLARDLHPLGKYMSVSVRDDLGSETVEQSYRQPTLTSFRFEPPLGTDVQKAKIEASNLGAHRWNSCFNSCPMNARNPKYSATFPGLIDSDVSDKTLQELWEADSRLEELSRICEKIRENCVGKNAGIVVFCEWTGTVDKIHEWAEEKDGIRVRKLRGLDNPLPGETQQYAYSDSTRKQSAQHRKNQERLLSWMKDNSTIDGDSPVNILVCGPGITVGHNMQWANYAIHWDINYGSVENIAQKTWRLDRLLSQDDDATTREFYVRYFIHQDDEDRRDDSNTKHQSNRLLLGDRRYIGANEDDYPILIPDFDAQFSPTWSSESKIIQHTNFEMQQVWKMLGPNQERNDVPGLAETLGLHFLCLMSGMRLDLDDIDEIEIDAAGEIGISPSDLHDLITLANPTERGSLQYLNGGYFDSQSVMTRYGPPTQDARAILNITPDGFLLTRFSKLMRRTAVEAQEHTSIYPFTMVADDCDYEGFFECNESIRFAAHTGILELKDNSEIWQLFKRFHGKHCPSGLMRCVDDESWKHVPISDLNDYNQRYDVILDAVNSLAVQETFSQFVPVDNSTVADKSAFDDSDDYIDMLDLRASEKFFEDQQAWWSAMGSIAQDMMKLQIHHHELTEHEDDVPHFIPLIHISKNNQEVTECPACQDPTDSSGYCQNQECKWDKNDESEPNFGWN